MLVKKTFYFVIWTNKVNYITMTY